MNPKIAEIEKAQAVSHRPRFRTGDTVRVYVRVQEGDKSRVQPYEGVVIARKGGGTRQTFTVRRISYGEGVERTFLLHSPLVEKIQVLKRGRVRRAKLYYLRKKIGKSARVAASASGAEQPRDEPPQPLPESAPVRPEPAAQEKT